MNVLHEVPALGGLPRKLVTDVDSPVAVSPDGTQLAFRRHNPGATPEEDYLLVVNADGSDERRVATRKSPLFFGNVAWSPDGKMLAVAARNGTLLSQVKVVLLPVGGGPEQTISPENWIYVGRLAWLPDGSGLLLDALDESFQHQLWHLAYPSGAAQRVTHDLNFYLTVGLTADARTLVTVQGGELCSLWVAPNGEAKRARQFTSRTSKYEGMGGVAWTPDGKLVYSSWKGTGADLWIRDPDGSNARQLTASSRAKFAPFAPVVSPDGHTIVFESLGAGMWRMDRDSGNLKQLTRGARDFSPQISPDGKWIIYESLSARTGRSSLWKISIDGGEPIELTQRWASLPGISPDGRLIAFQTYDVQTSKFAIAIMPFHGGEPMQWIERPADFGAAAELPPGLSWAPDGQSIYCIRTSKGVSNLWTLPLRGGAPKQVTDFATDQIFAYAWSRDGKQLAVVRGTRTTDVILLSNFR